MRASPNKWSPIIALSLCEYVGISWRLGRVYARSAKAFQDAFREGISDPIDNALAHCVFLMASGQSAESVHLNYLAANDSRSFAKVDFINDKHICGGYIVECD